MKFHQMTYLAKESMRTLGRHKGVMFLSIVIMSLSLLVLAVFLLATDNMLSFLDRTRQDFRVYVYLQDNTDQFEIETYYKQLLALESVETLEFISKDQALRDFRAELGDDADILETLASNPLPASFRVTLKKPFRDQEGIEAFAATAADLPGVEEVNYGKDFIERFSLMARVFLTVNVVLGLIVFLSSLFIISNTVRLTILSRRRQIEILKLVGATNRFITTPFLMEGAVQGGLASAVSLSLLTVIYAGGRKILPDLEFLSPDKIALYVLTCVLLGSAGSFAALRRFLRL